MILPPNVGIQMLVALFGDKRGDVRTKNFGCRSFARAKDEIYTHTRITIVSRSIHRQGIMLFTNAVCFTKIDS